MDGVTFFRWASVFLVDKLFFGEVDLEKEAKRLFYRGKIQILKGYRKNVIQANEDMEIGIRKYRSAYGFYVNPWSGETRAAYDQIGGELNAMEGRIYQLGDELLVRINQEIRRLEGKVDDYK